MDPNQTLAEIRELLISIEDSAMRDMGGIRVMSANLTEKFHSLDEWLKNGGFLPNEWQRYR